VQHHHAHIAACLADNGLPLETQVIGVALDGTGYGDDGAIWGGEFLVGGYRAVRRAAHLRYVPLPGGDRAVREPWRIALSWLYAAGIEWQAGLPPVAHAQGLGGPLPPLEVVRRQAQGGANAPLTSSMGRLFDAAAAILGVRQQATYEAQAAIELEAIASGREPGYYLCPLDPTPPAGPLVVDPAPLLRTMVDDLRRGAPQPVIAARFHSSIARLVCDVCDRLRQETGLTSVALSGGVWQNMFLLTLTVGLLHERGFEIYLHRQAPANDGGLALGQAAVAAALAA
ncbi:MAG: carbamoyltransferase HypF, partial [Chloroflexota bacterium]